MVRNDASALQVVESANFDQAQRDKEQQRLERKHKLIDIYYRQFITATEGSAKLANALIRYANLILKDDEPDQAQAESHWALMELICSQLSTITPRILMQAFPVEKSYDGEQWGTKDYFSSMLAIEEHGIDNPIGDRPIKGLLWDYMNHHVMNFVVRYLSCMSAMYKKASGKGIMEEWFEGQGIPLYYRGTDAYGREVMVNSQTGEASPISKPKPRKPRWWRVVRGKNI